MQTARNKLRLIWADKIVLFLAMSIVVIAGLGWLFVALAAGLMGANHVFASLGIGNAPQIAVFLLAVWGTLRALDFVFHGSTYKLFHAAPQDAPVPLPTGTNLLAH